MFEDYRLVTHRNCADGAATAVLFQNSGGKDVIFVSPGQNADEVVTDLYHNFPGKVIFADISVSLDVALLLDARKHDFVLLDHHVSSVPLKKFSWCEIEEKNTRCGSMMLFDWIKQQQNKLIYKSRSLGITTLQKEHLNEYRRFVELIDDYDRWVKAFGQETEDLASLFLCLGQKLFIERFLKDPSAKLQNKERYLLEVDQARKQDLLKQKKKDVKVYIKHIQGKDRRVAFVMVHDHHNEVAEAIYNDQDLAVDLVIIVGDRISFRSPERSEVDCSKLAASLKGGGHIHASGTSLKNVLGVDLTDLVASKINQHPTGRCGKDCDPDIDIEPFI